MTTETVQTINDTNGYSRNITTGYLNVPPPTPISISINGVLIEVQADMKIEVTGSHSVKIVHNTPQYTYYPPVTAYTYTYTRPTPYTLTYTA